MATGTEFELADPPSDGISRVVFAPQADNLMVASWDTTCSLYDVQANTKRVSFKTPSPVLDCCFADDATGFCGGLDGSVRSMDFVGGKDEVIGNHDEGVRCAAYAQSQGLLVTGSWDKTVGVWDPRSKQQTASLQQPDKVYAMAVSGDRVIVGTAGRHVWVWDVRKTDAPEQRRESSLKYQTRCITANPDGSGYVLSSIEGRVSVEYLDSSPEEQKKKFAFKCHRLKEEGKDTIFPVNALAFHPTYRTFATGGGDGLVNVWDPSRKKRLCQFHRYPTSISSLAFNATGNTLAISASYTYEEGEKDHPSDTVYIRGVTDEELH
eukprot:m.37370 g.37370  ORF g.37370 m.37370 type:complete len:322 (-) comp11103_c0_seq2:1691-2656(-)